MLRELNREYVANGSKAKDAMHYDNVINWPLLTGPDDKLVLDMFPPPQLHLMIRIVNHILDNLSKVSKKWYGQDYVLDFVKQTGIARQDYHGGGFEGRVVNKILQKFTISWLKAPTSAFTLKNLLRHYAKQAFKYGKLREISLTSLF